MPKPSEYKAVLFDKDGTLFSFTATWGTFCDRMISHLASTDEALKDLLAETVGYDRHAGQFKTGSLIVSASAGEVDEAWANLAPNHDLAAVETLTRQELNSLPLVPTCDLNKVMRMLKAQGLKLGVTTNDYEQGAINQLAEAEVTPLFDFVCGSDSGYGRKPGPGMIHGFCELNGLTPDQIIFVGDSTHDMHCGRNAGAGLCVGVLTGPATRTELETTANIVLSSVAELPDFLLNHTRGE
ncbi:HAD family hydrolase [Parasedimentitalea maritima]|uniref:phosphoglycolate phosphatase n=1 Tax=Parasedimentitalea maritima TaxID=2578117 RepID=A0ABY2UVC9_9RHOB|nr:HAD family hydrolase [Zongyanglinia marina]TLP65596.1 HAD family hydrolase [Zongyanglinia marina]